MLVCMLLLAMIPALCAQEMAADPQGSAPQQAATQTQSAHAPSPSQADRAASRRVSMNCEEVLEIPIAPSEPPLRPAEEQAASLGRVVAEPPALSPGGVIKIILGFVVLAALAYLGGHPVVQRIEHKLQISHIVTAGIPFIILGVIASDPRVGVLSDVVLKQIRPIIIFGLGWIGFTVGFRFDVRLLNPLPRRLGATAALMTFVPAAVVALLAIPILMAASDAPFNPTFFRDALIVGFAGAMTARSAPMLLQRRGAGAESVDRMWMLVHLEQLAGVVGLLLLAAYFRPQGLTVAWQLPGTGWLFVTLGVAGSMAAVSYLVLGKATAGPQFYVVLLGSICFAAGMATFLRLSAVVVCFFAGAVLVNFPSPWKAQVGEALARLERPVYFLFLVIAGALWRQIGWQGWMLMFAFIISRIAAKWFAVGILRRQMPETLTRLEQRGLIIGPIGALSIAIVVNAQDLYSGPSIPSTVTAVIGGAILTEIIIQFALRRGYLNAQEAADTSIRY